MANLKINNGESGATIRNTINGNYQYYYLARDGSGTYITSSDNFVDTYNTLTSAVTTDMSVAFSGLTVGMRGSQARALINNTFDNLAVSSIFTGLVGSNEYLRFPLTSSGDGTGVAICSIAVSEDTIITLNGVGKFYTDAACTQNESDTWNLTHQHGVTWTTRYVKVTSGQSDMLFNKNKIYIWKQWGGDTVLANEPSIAGDIGLLTNLNILEWNGNNTVSGDVGNLVNINYAFSIGGSNTLHGDIALMGSATSGLWYLQLSGNNTIYGSIAGQTAMVQLTLEGSNTITGSLNALTSMWYCKIGGNNTISGALASLVALSWAELNGNNTITGDINDISSLGYFDTNNSSITYSRALASTGLSYLKIPSTVTLTSANVNQILADFITNKDEAKGFTYRVIDLRGSASTGAPTGQGIVDKAALQIYRSPNNDPAKNLWTVTTR